MAITSSNAGGKISSFHSMLLAFDDCSTNHAGGPIDINGQVHRCFRVQSPAVGRLQKFVPSFCREPSEETIEGSLFKAKVLSLIHI